MADEAAIYREKMSEVIEVPGADNLVQGAIVGSEVKISTAGKYVRGELMMSSGGNEFKTATAEGLSSAQEICILTRDCIVEEGNDFYTAGYFTGTFSGESLVLSYETEEDDHAELLAAVKATLRRHAIFLV